jgi:hypothetical protein
MFAGERLQRAWSGQLHRVKIGEPTFDHVLGMGLFQYLALNPEEGTLFNDAMASLTSQLSATVAKSHDFSRFGTIADVGGGNGTS